MNAEVSGNAQRGEQVRERNSVGRHAVAQQALMTAANTIVRLVLFIGVMVAPVFAQPYPNKPIRFIMPFGPGGGADIAGRIVGPKLSERFGQPVVIENRGGSGGNIGAELVAKARPDGYTILFLAMGGTISRSLYKKLNYDVTKDFAPISVAAQINQVLLVSPSLPVKNLKELVDYARANPGKLNFGSPGAGTTGQLTVELFKSYTKIDIVHVPYKGIGEALLGLIRGDVDMMSSNISSAVPQIKAGKVRALAALSDKRLLSLPDLPTATESGINRYAVPIWWGIVAPAGTPRDVVRRLNAEWVRSAATPDTIEKMRKSGIETVSNTPEEFAEMIKSEVVRWAKVIKEANIPRLD